MHFQSSWAYVYHLTSLEGVINTFSKFIGLCDIRLQVQGPIVHLTQQEMWVQDKQLQATD